MSFKGIPSSRRSVLPPPPSRTLAAPNPFSSKEDLFVSGERFEFKSPNRVMTRARRSSIYCSGLSSAGNLVTSSSKGGQKGRSIGNKLGSIAEKKVLKPISQRTETKKASPEIKLGARRTTSSTEAKMIVRRSSRQPIKTIKRTKKTSPTKLAVPDAPVVVQATPPPPPPKSAKKVVKKEGVPAGLSRSPPGYDEALFRDVQVILEKLQRTPAKRLADPNVVFEELEDVKDSPKRVELVCKSLLKEAKFLQKQEEEKKSKNLLNNKTPEMPSSFKMPSAPTGSSSKKRVTRSARKTSKAPESSGRILSNLIVPKLDLNPPPSALTSSIVPGTPQPVAANPSALLRHNLKTKVREQMEEKVSKMPVLGSPYSMMEGETESGSPRSVFTKLSENPRKSKYLTGTPGVVRKNNSRVAMRSIGNCDPSRITLKSSSPLNKDDINKSNNINNSTSLKENSSSVLSSPVKSPQLMTGDLAKVCVVM